MVLSLWNVLKSLFWKKKEAKPEPQIKDTNDSISMIGNMQSHTFDLYNQDMDVDPIQLESHKPSQQLSPLDDVEFHVLAAADIKKRHLMPHLFANPLQHLDYKIYESLLKHTFIGALSDAFIKYLMGDGFEPELELINPDEDNEKNIKLIQANQDIITKLKQIDNQIERNSDDELDTSFKHKVNAMVTSMLLYNRGALVFSYEKPIKLDGKIYPQIPSHVMFAHAVDLGMIDINPQTRRLISVQWKLAYESFVKVKDMIYLWNPMTSAKIHNSWFYGISMLTPMISASKIIRQLLSNDFPAMAKNAWAGLYLLTVRNEGQTTESKTMEYNAIIGGLREPGHTAVLIKDPQDTRLDNIQYDPKIAEFQGLFESMIKLCISQMGLPQVGFYDEAAANRDTMVGKIQLTMRTTIDPMRKWLDEMISPQWWQRWFMLLYKDQPEKTDMFRIKMKFRNIHIAEWYDNIEAALAADGRHQFKNRSFGELADIEDYESMLEPNEETTAGGQQSMSMTDGESGNKLEMSQKKGKGKKGGKPSDGGKNGGK